MLDKVLGHVLISHILLQKGKESNVNWTLIYIEVAGCFKGWMKKSRGEVSRAQLCQRSENLQKGWRVESGVSLHETQMDLLTGVYAVKLLP